MSNKSKLNVYSANRAICAGEKFYLGESDSLLQVYSFRRRGRLVEAGTLNGWRVITGERIVCNSETVKITCGDKPPSRFR